MKKKHLGIDKGLTNYGDKEFSKFLRRSFAKSMGYTNKSLNKPIVGICYTESGFNNCHRNFPEILEPQVDTNAVDLFCNVLKKITKKVIVSSS